MISEREFLRCRASRPPASTSPTTSRPASPSGSRRGRRITCATCCGSPPAPNLPSSTGGTANGGADRRHRQGLVLGGARRADPPASGRARSLARLRAGQAGAHRLYRREGDRARRRAAAAGAAPRRTIVERVNVERLQRQRGRGGGADRAAGRPERPRAARPSPALLARWPAGRRLVCLRRARSAPPIAEVLAGSAARSRRRRGADRPGGRLHGCGT